MPFDGLAVERHLARRGLDQAQHRARQRRLAAAGLADDAEDLALAPLERDPVDRPRDLAVDAELDRQVADLHQGRGCRGGHPLTSVVVTAGSSICGHSLHGAKWHAAAWPAATSRRAGSVEAAVGGVRAAGSEATALGQVARIRRATRDRRRQAAHAADHRQRVEQPLGVGVLRGVEDGAHRADLDDPARVHHRDPVAGLGEHPEVVGDQDQRQPKLLAQALEQLQNLRLHDHVERGRRLVGDHERRAAGQGERDHHPLALTAGELVGVTATDRGGQPDGLEQLVDALADLVRGGVRRVEDDRLLELVLDPLDRVEGVHRALEDERDVTPADVAHPGLGPPVEPDRLGLGLDVQGHLPRLLQPAGQQLHQRQRRGGLAAPRLAGEPERLARLDHQVDAVDDRLASGAHVQVLDLEQRAHAGTCSSSSSRGLTYSSNR